MKIAELFVKLGLKSSEYDSGMNKAKTKAEGFGSSMKKIGGIIAGAFAVGEILNFGKELVNMAAEASKAQMKVATAVKQTGMAAGFTATELENIASGLQKMTTFEDDNILANLTTQLLTFTNIAGVNFERAQEAALNLATVLDVDLKGIAIQLGKALNDPVKGLAALSRSGIQFSKEQRNMITGLVESNRLFEAQSIMLDEIDRQYGGQARAMASLPIGKIEQLANRWGDVKEMIGQVILGSNTMSNVVDALAGYMEVYTSDVAGFWTKLLATFDVTGNIFNKIRKEIRETAAEQEKNNKLQKDYIDYLKGLAAQDGNKKQIKTIQDLQDEIDGLNESLLLMDVTDRKGIKTTVELIDKKTKQLESLTKLKEKYDMAAFSADLLYENEQKLSQLVGQSKDFKVNIEAADPEIEGFRDIFSKFGLEDEMEEAIRINTQKRAEEIENWKKFSEDLDSLIGGSIVSTIEEFGLSLGELFSGQINVSEFGKNMLGAIGKFLGDFGKMLIAYGIAQEAFWSSLGLGPIGAGLAIAAGAALVAIGGVITGMGSKASKGELSAGTVSGGSGYSKPRDNFGGNNARGDSKVVFELYGDKLRAVLDNSERKKLIIG